MLLTGWIVDKPRGHD